MRTVATALESYYVDNNHYPPFGQPNYTVLYDVNAVSPHFLTSPIAYLSSGDTLRDIFRVQKQNTFWWSLQFYYRNFDDPRHEFNRGEMEEKYGMWRLTSVGPDTFIFNGNFEGNSKPSYMEIIYDPSNGTVSVGDIERNQKYSERKI
jgi:hypothetical protein